MECTRPLFSGFGEASHHETYKYTYAYFLLFDVPSFSATDLQLIVSSLLFIPYRHAGKSNIIFVEIDRHFLSLSRLFELIGVQPRTKTLPTQSSIESKGSLSSFVRGCAAVRRAPCRCTPSSVKHKAPVPVLCAPCVVRRASCFV